MAGILINGAGDCCSLQWRGDRLRLESWKAAQSQGAHTAAALLGQSHPYISVPRFWSDQYDLPLHVVGLFDPLCPVSTRGSSAQTSLVFQQDASDRVQAAAGIGPGNGIAKEISIFEKLSGRQASHDPSALADPSENLKRLLKAA